jgi:cytochrome b561
LSTITAEQRIVSVPERYDSTAVAFHWIVAALVVILGALGLLFGEIPRDARPFWINVHGCVGLVYFALVIMRFAWRLTHRPPELPPDIGEFDRQMSLAAHHALYVLMLLIPLFGVVAYIWHGRVFDYGLFQLDFRVGTNREVFKPAEMIHQWLAYGLFALAGLHILAALYHRFVRRDGVLSRMLPR